MRNKAPRSSKFAGALGAAIVSLACATAPTASRAEDYPTRTVTIVVPFTPGGTTDLLGRLLAGRLAHKFGQSFVVENKPGAGGLTACVGLAHAAPDGYTLMIAPSSVLATNVTLYKKLPYDPLADFVPLALLLRTPFALVVNPALGVTSVADLVARAKIKPGALAFASAGPGTAHHLFAELFQTLTGTQLTHVPYKGVAPALNDVVGGHVPLMFTDVAPALGMIREGKLQPLGVTSKARVAAIANVPPLDDSVAGFDATSWQMTIAPAATPPAIVSKLNSEIATAMTEPDIAKQVVDLGMLPVERASSESLRAFIKSEIDTWGAIVRKAGIAATQ